MKNCENCGNFDRTNNKGTEACGECQTIEPTQWKPTMTNGDRIRAMTDEELAEYFNDLATVCNCCVDNKNCTDPFDRPKCICGVLNWLKQPMEVEE